METKKIPYPAQSERDTEKNIYTTILSQHYALIHPKQYKKQPNAIDMKEITIGMQRRYFPRLLTIKEIFEACSKGQAIIPANVERESTAKDARLSFVSSSLLMIDIDDDFKQTDPHEVLRMLGDTCVGFFYTFSHGIKGNRYRLVFKLSHSIRNEKLYIKVAQIVAKKLQGILPASLDKTKKIVDAGATKPLIPIRTGIQGYVISNYSNTLQIEEIEQEAQKQLQEELLVHKEKLLKRLNRDYDHDFSYPVEELKERAKVIGQIPDFETWQSIGYSLKDYAETGKITDEEAFEIFEIMGDGYDHTKFWTNLKPNRTNIGHFINVSNSAGFKRDFRYYHAVSSKKYVKTKIEERKFDKYIPTDFAKEILELEQIILVKAPTGSGKTSSFIEAAKEISASKELPSRYYIVAVPTIAITDQTGHDKGILAIRGETGNIFKRLKEYSDEGNRVVVVTYDMAAATKDMIKKINPFSSFTYIIDEFHQLIHSFNYRQDAVESLYALKSSAKGFIGLSGTIDDILRNDFDKEIHIQTNYMNAPCLVWGAITYKKAKDEEPQLIQLIKQKVEREKKLLVFIQQKEVIKRIYDILSKSGIVTRTITSESKKSNKAYRHIVEKSEFPEGVQVILTTTVLSDGININNAKKDAKGEIMYNQKGEVIADTNFECIVLASRQSPNFNVSMVRQTANRFRYTYGGFYIFMLRPIKQTNYLYNIDQSHEYEKNIAQNAVDLLNDEFRGRGNSKLFRKSVVEERLCIDFNELEEAYYNELRLRFNVSLEKNKFYSIFRSQFIAALTLLMQTEPAPSIDITEYLEREEVDISTIEESIEEIKAKKTLSNSEMAEQIELYYTPIVHQAFKDGNEDVLDEFRKVSTADHFKTLKQIAPVADYKTALKIVKRVKRKADIFQFKKRMDALLDIFYFQQVNRKTPTKEAFLELTRHIGVAMTKEQLNDVIAKVSKVFRRSKKVDVEYIAKNYFYHEKTRDERERFTTLHVLEKSNILTEFGLDEQEFNKVMYEIINKENSTKQTVLQKLLQN